MGHFKSDAQTNSYGLVMDLLHQQPECDTNGDHQQGKEDDMANNYTFTKLYLLPAYLVDWILQPK